MKIMSNEKQLIRWERHYSDGSVEYTDEESTNNFEDNLSSVGGLIASRSYIQMKPVEWHERKAENLPISDVRLSLCCKAPVDKDDNTSQYCTNCLDACESYSA
jgi:hypothetical protein